jgi:hypothetical protein
MPYEARGVFGRIAAELETFIRDLHAYPRWRYGLEYLRPDLRRRAKRLLKRSPRPTACESSVEARADGRRRDSVLGRNPGLSLALT